MFNLDVYTQEFGPMMNDFHLPATATCRFTNVATYDCISLSSLCSLFKHTERLCETHEYSLCHNKDAQ